MKKNNNYILLIITLCIVLTPLMAFTQVLFKTGQSINTSSQYAVVGLGDVNNDGRIDLVAGTTNTSGDSMDGKIIVYLQSVTGTFPTKQSYTYFNAYPGIKTLEIADVNNDSLNDVIIGYKDSIGIFYQNNLGTLNPKVSYYSGSLVVDLKVGDLNNDGLLDIAVSHSGVNNIKVFYQSPTEFTTNVYTSNSNSNEIEIGDLNSDGLNDLVLLRRTGLSSILVYNQNGDGKLDNYISYLPSGNNSWGLNGIEIGDLNNDGANDIIATRGGNKPNAHIVIWYQDTLTKLLKTAINLLADEIPRAIEVADFNCDGKQEIFINHGGWNYVTVWSPNDSGNYKNYDTYRVSVSQQPLPKSLAAGDINNDGRLDIVTVGDIYNIQLLYNISIPTSYTSIDTNVVIDTISVQNNDSKYYYTTQKIDTIRGQIIIRTDSFQVLQTNRQKFVETNFTYFRRAHLCSFVYTDVVKDSFVSMVLFERIDTSLWSSTIDSVKIIEKINPIAVDIFPNPFFTRLYVRCNNNEPIIVSLFNCLGQQILQHTFTNTTTINTEQISVGLYFFELSNSTGTLKTGKLVKL